MSRATNWFPPDSRHSRDGVMFEWSALVDIHIVGRSVPGGH